MTGAAERWDQKWTAARGPLGSPHPMVRALVEVLPPGAWVLDVAAGRGRQTRALVAAGLRVTAVDVSAVGLAQLRDNVRGPVATVRADLSRSLPVALAGPYDAIVCVDYCEPELWPRLRARLAPGGLLVMSLATMRNLEQNAQPSRRFLVDPSWAPLLLGGELSAEQVSAAWRDNGRHELWVWGQRD